MYIDGNTIITFVAVLSSLGILGGAALTVHKWILRQNAQDAELKKIHEELAINTRAVWACLKVIGDNGNEEVKTAIRELETHLIEKGH